MPEPAAGNKEMHQCKRAKLSGNNGSSSGHHVFHMTPRIRMLLRAQRHLGTVIPIQVPVFNAMHALVRVHVDPELIARTSPRELPSPVSLLLVGECIWVNVIKAKTLQCMEIFQPVFETFLHLVGAASFSLCLCGHLSSFLF